jgi:hypothetical protein
MRGLRCGRAANMRAWPASLHACARHRIIPAPLPAHRPPPQVLCSLLLNAALISHLQGGGVGPRGEAGARRGGGRAGHSAIAGVRLDAKGCGSSAAAASGTCSSSGAWCLLFYTCALGCKQTALVMPLLAFFLDVWRGRDRVQGRGVWGVGAAGMEVLYGRWMRWLGLASISGVCVCATCVFVRFVHA